MNFSQLHIRNHLLGQRLNERIKVVIPGNLLQEKKWKNYAKSGPTRERSDWIEDYAILEKLDTAEPP